MAHGPMVTLSAYDQLNYKQLSACKFNSSWVDKSKTKRAFLPMTHFDKLSSPVKFH